MLTRWNPFEDLSTLHREVDRLFGRAFSDSPTGGAAQASFVPAVEVVTGKDAWTVRMAIPGVDPKNVQIEVAGDTLTVRGERRREETRQPYLTEFSYGQFERTLTLPESIDGEKVTATYRNGMLDLTLPLHESVKPRKIQVAVEKDKGEKELAGVA